MPRHQKKILRRESLRNSTFKRDVFETSNGVRTASLSFIFTAHGSIAEPGCITRVTQVITQVSS
jgi:hypothetical protein